MRTTYFVDVILPLAVPNLYTYRVPFELNDEIGVGKRVLVSFGSSKIYAAIVENIHQNPPKHYQAKYIEFILDETAIVTELQRKFWFWLSKYYMANIGEVLLASLPNSLRLASETQVLPIEVPSEIQEKLTPTENLIYDLLWVKQRMSVAEIAAELDKKTVYTLVKTMLEKGVVALEEEVHERYKPLMKPFVKLHSNLASSETINQALDMLNRAPKQQDALMAILHKTGNDFGKWISRKMLEKEFSLSPALFNGLLGKNLIEIKQFQVDRIPQNKAKYKDVVLSETQQNTAQQIREGFQQNKPVLLHGVTGSGKTEIYIQLIDEAIQQGKQVLYLVPEIALTGQLTGRLEAYFGKKLRFYHSKFTNNERAEIWYKLLEDDEVKVIVGARSAIFLPFSNLGLVVVDEEHDASFKQQNPSPRYQARDAAIVLANLHKSQVLLGSATPSLESYYNAKQGKFHYVSLFERFGTSVLPEILIAEMKLEHKEKTLQGDFSSMLLQEITNTIEKGKQVILFQNRRGFSPRWLCKTCAWVPSCKNCDISLTYHKFKHQLRCHYCGYHINPPTKCLACGTNDIAMMGFGTEKIEDDLALFLPNAKIGRMDYDTTRGKNAYQQIIQDFQEGNINVLVGTQMVTKGLDFDKVGLVGVLSADQIISFPDFRAIERAFQLMTQVAGRAGRRGEKGKVIIQAFHSEHQVLQQVIDGNIMEMYRIELAERNSFHYPPFYRLIGIVAKHRDKDLVMQASQVLMSTLRTRLQERVLGPEFPAIARIRNQFITESLIKMEPTLDYAKVKLFIENALLELKQNKQFRSVRFVVDVDPY